MGYIRLTATVLVKSDITITGQTVPRRRHWRDGRRVSFNSATNVIMRDFRFRQGDLDPNNENNGLNWHGTIASGTAPADSDRDGMPNAGETRYGLNPNSAADAAGDFDRTGYTNVEKYVNGLLDGTYPT